MYEPSHSSATLGTNPQPDGMVWIFGGEFSMGSEGMCDGKSCCCLPVLLEVRPTVLRGPRFCPHSEARYSQLNWFRNPRILSVRTVYVLRSLHVLALMKMSQDFWG